MANAAFICPSKIREQTAEMRGSKTDSLRCIANLLARRARIVIAEWHSRARRRETLARLNDRLLADVGLTREKQIVDCSKLFYWLP